MRKVLKEIERKNSEIAEVGGEKTKEEKTNVYSYILSKVLKIECREILKRYEDR